MALKTTGAEKPPETPPPATVMLELSLYTHYTWGGVTYEKGTAYRFTQTDALALLSEEDYGRPIWRRFTPPKPKRAVNMPVVDQTEVRAVRTRQSLEDAAYSGAAPIPGKRIDVGTDEEIADILARPEDLSGDVTV